MPKLTKALPPYRKHRASGQAVVTLSGRDHYLGPHGTQVSKLAYDRLVAECLQNGRQLAEGADEGLTVVEVIAAYLRFAKKYYRKGKVQISEYIRYDGESQFGRRATHLHGGARSSFQRPGHSASGRCPVRRHDAGHAGRTAGGEVGCHL